MYCTCSIPVTCLLPCPVIPKQHACCYWLVYACKGVSMPGKHPKPCMLQASCLLQDCTKLVVTVVTVMLAYTWICLLDVFCFFLLLFFFLFFFLGVGGRIEGNWNWSPTHYVLYCNVALILHMRDTVLCQCQQLGTEQAPLWLIANKYSFENTSVFFFVLFLLLVKLWQILMLQQGAFKFLNPANILVLHSNCFRMGGYAKTVPQWWNWRTSIPKLWLLILSGWTLVSLTMTMQKE